MFGEVLIASFFLQLFALVTPLFFQVVMDKVLVQKGFTTLDILAFGFVVVAIFDAILGGMRNYLFSHTTNRVDVELGAKLFHHLVSLPLAYFEARQVGQSVARVKELDTIRNFITGTALTLLIDLSFTFVFFAVLWYYSPLLTWVVLGSIPFYIALPLFITPILKHRLDKKFQYGARNQAFLTEAITGVETLKAQALEPQMQRRWEDQLSKYVTSSFRAQNLNNVANQVATDDAGTTNEDTVKVFTVAELLANDSDVDGGPLFITGVSNASNGSVIFNSTDQTITFTPDADYHGPASFDYTLSDGSATDTGTVNLTIDPINDAPVANDDIANGTEDTAVFLTFAELLANDSDVDGDALTISGVSNASNGSVSIDATAETITFTPDAGYSGAASFDYTLVQADGTAVDTAVVNITISPSDPVTNYITGTSASQTLNGTDGNDVIDGLAGNDVINAGLGDDILIGGTGYDELYGGGGDDTFIVDPADTSADRTYGGEGFDRIVAGDGDDTIGIRYLTDSYSIEQIDGGSGVNRIQGSNYTNYLDFSSVELVNIEHTFVGGGGDDTIIGTSSDDTLIGGTGYDKLYGGAGDDTFIVDAADTSADLRTGGEGFDRIVTGDGDDTIRICYLTESYSIEQIDGGLGINTIEGTTMRDVWDFSTVELINIEHIFDGGNGNDEITGTSNDDILIGGAGSDTLRGGAGSDTYQFSSGDGHDTINNIGADVTEVDSLLFDDVANDELWLSKSGDNLIVDVVGKDDWVKISDWYADDSNQLDTIEASNLLLHRDQVDQLVNAMAAFDVPDGVGAVVPEDVRQQLEPTLTSVWQVS